MADVTRWRQSDGRTVLWSNVTGRHIALGDEALARLEGPEGGALRRRLDTLDLLADPDPLQRIPCRHASTLLLPDRPALWLPVPGSHGAGGHAWQALPLSADEHRLWRAMNSRYTLGQLVERTGVHRSDAVALCRRLTRPEHQALQLHVTPPTAWGRAALSRLVSPPREANARPADRYGSEGQTTLTSWHLAIANGERHFDDVETTVAHALGRPHAALSGVRFGERLRAALRARGWTDSGWTVEIGCGSGEVAAAWADDDYLRIDLSPALLATQATTAPGTHALCADGVRLPLRDGSIDRVINNEVIADLEAVPVGPDSSGDRARTVRAALERFGITPWPHRAWYNLGAWQLIEEIARVLRPGGTAYVSEFGDDAPPEEATQLDHPEVSIHFGHLARVAVGCGLEVTRIGMAELLGADLHARQLERRCYQGLRALAAAEGWSLEARAYEPHTLTLPRPVEGLRWVPTSDEGPGPLITRFEALLLRKPT